jgi:hypothetical protein
MWLVSDYLFVGLLSLDTTTFVSNPPRKRLELRVGSQDGRLSALQGSEWLGNIMS